MQNSSLPSQSPHGSLSEVRGPVNPGLILALGTAILGTFIYGFWNHHLIIDDAYIAFQYSRNLVEGHGLVFNPGERVEGYTQPLWVLLVALGMFVGISPEAVATGLGFASGIAVLLLVARVAWAWSGGHLGWTTLPVLALAVNRSFVAWSSGGLGTQLFVLMCMMGAWTYFTERKLRSQWPWKSGIFFALAMLSRPEGAIFTTVVGFFFVAEVLCRRRSFKSLAFWATCCLAIVGAHMAWRVSYYNDWLPNTFYAKVSGAWLSQAKVYLRLFAQSHLLYAFAPFLLMYVIGWNRQSAARWMFITQGAVYCGYLVYVGGDHFEFRFMTPVIPLIYLLWSDAARQLCIRISGQSAGRAMAGRVTAAIAALLILASAAYPSLRPTKLQKGIAPLERLDQFVTYRIAEGKFFRKLVEDGHLPADTLIAVRGAGAMPYFSRLPIVDVHGLNDRHVAKQKLEHRGTIGHEKVATPEYLQERGAVMIEISTKTLFPPEFSPKSRKKNVALEYYRGPIYRMRIDGRYLAIGTTLSEEEFRKYFSAFEHLP